MLEFNNIEEMKENREKITLLVCIMIMLAILVIISNFDVKERYEQVQKEKQYLLEQNIEYQNKIKILENEQDNKTNNLDTRF